MNASSVLTKGYEADIVFWPKNPKANLPENQVNARSVLAKGYEADIVFWPKNPKANSNPISEMPKMNVNTYITRKYDIWTLGKRGKNEPKTNPIYRGVASGEAGTNPIYPVVASGEAGSKPI